MRGEIVKLTRPRVEAALARLHLFRRLDGRRQVMWISAPPGTGKTTLLSTWVARRRLPCLWYSLDAADADLGTFFHFLALAAPRRKRPLPPLTPDRRMGLPVFARQFFAELGARLPPRAILVFDNHHEVPAAAGLDSILRAGIASLRPGQRVVVVSRAPPSPEWAGLEAGDMLGRLGEEHLRVSFAEAQAIARRRRKRIPREALRLIHQRTGGWVVALVLFLERSLGLETPAIVLDYLAKEHLEHLPAPLREMLLRVAIPPRVSAKMAHLLAGEKAAAALAELARRGSFVAVRKGPIYELHPLLRELLLARGADELGDAELHRLRGLAARLAEEEGELETAAELHAAARDWPALTALACARAPSLLAEGRAETLERWLSQLPPGAEPWVSFWRGQCRLHRDPAAAREHFARAFEGFRRDGDRLGQLAAWPGAVWATVAASDDLAPVDPWIAAFEALAPRAEELPPHLAPALMMGLVFALNLRAPQHPRKAEWVAQALRVHQSDAGDPAMQVLLGCQLIENAFFLGAAAEARAVLDRLMLVHGRTATAPMPQLALAHAEAVCRLQSGDSSGALAAVERGLRIAEGSGVVLLNLLLHADAARAALIADDLPRARSHLRGFLAASPPGSRVHSAHHAYLAAWEALADGDPARATSQAASAARLLHEVGAPIPLAQTCLLLAEAHVERGEKAEALAALARAQAIAAATGSLSLQAQCAMAEAHLRGEPPAAALRLARSDGLPLLVTFACRPETFARLCQRAIEHEVEAETARALLGLRGLGRFEPPRSLESWPWPVKLRLCGRFAIEVGGKPLRETGKTQRRPRELLAILVALGGRDVQEAQSADRIWPDADGDQAQRSFEVTLHRLRALLGDPTLVKRRDGLVSLDGSRVFADVWAIEDLLRESPERAAALYAGPFLPGNPADWAVAARARLESQFAYAIRMTSRGTVPRRG
ncbi:MAG: hypothetical protein ACXWLM_04820 [Myxococcales bacterium]